MEEKRKACPEPEPCPICKEPEACKECEKPVKCEVCEKCKECEKCQECRESVVKNAECEECEACEECSHEVELVLEECEACPVCPSSVTPIEQDSSNCTAAAAAAEADSASTCLPRGLVGGDKMEDIDSFQYELWSLEQFSLEYFGDWKENIILFPMPGVNVARIGDTARVLLAAPQNAPIKDCRRIMLVNGGLQDHCIASVFGSETSVQTQASVHWSTTLKPGLKGGGDQVKLFQKHFNQNLATDRRDTISKMNKDIEEYEKRVEQGEEERSEAKVKEIRDKAEKRLAEFDRIEAFEKNRTEHFKFFVTPQAEVFGRDRERGDSMSTRRPAFEFIRGLLNGWEGLKEKLEVLLKDQPVDYPVITICTNYGHIELLVNWLCGVSEKDRQSTLVFAADERTERVMKAMGIRVVFDPAALGELPAESASSYGDARFAKMMWLKTVSVWSVLQMGFDVLFQDADVVWFQSPISYLSSGDGKADEFSSNSRFIAKIDKPPLPMWDNEKEAFVKRIDALFSREGGNDIRFEPFYANTGFFYMKRNSRTVIFWDHVLLLNLEMNRSGSQQAIVNRVMGHFYNEGRLAPFVLDRELFVAGDQFYKNKTGMVDLKERRWRPFTFHMNWTTNKTAKIDHLDTIGQWNLDNDYLKSWRDNEKHDQFDLSKICKKLKKEWK